MGPGPQVPPTQHVRRYEIMKNSKPAQRNDALQAPAAPLTCVAATGTPRVAPYPRSMKNVTKLWRRAGSRRGRSGHPPRTSVRAANLLVLADRNRAADHSGRIASRSFGAPPLRASEVERHCSRPGAQGGTRHSRSGRSRSRRKVAGGSATSVSPAHRQRAKQRNQFASRARPFRSFGVDSSAARVGAHRQPRIWTVKGRRMSRAERLPLTAGAPEMLRTLLSSLAAVRGRPPWRTKPRDWLTVPRRWMARDQGRRALAEVADDHVSELSEIGRQVRREERRRMSGQA
jgi:hypothetical protein